MIFPVLGLHPALLHPPHLDLHPHTVPSPSIQPLCAVSTHLTSPPCLLPINFGADGRALLSLCELDWQGLVINVHRRPVICRSAPSPLFIALSFNSPLPSSPPNLPSFLYSSLLCSVLLYLYCFPPSLPASYSRLYIEWACQHFYRNAQNLWKNPFIYRLIEK